MRVTLRLVVLAIFIVTVATSAASTFTTTPERVFEEPTPVVDNTFSYAMSASGGEVLISAVGDFATIPGVAYLFDTQTAGYQQTYSNPSAHIDNFFGNALAIGGDSVFVAAAEDSTSAAYAGTVYQFDRLTGAFERSYASPSPGDYNQFGSALAISGNHLLIGESGADPSAVADAGSVHVFDFTDGSFKRTLSPPAPLGGEQLGQSLAVLGAYVAAGAPRDGAIATQAGAVYVFEIGAGTYQGVLRKSVPTSGTFERFGSSLAALGTKLVVGAPLDLDGGAPTDRTGAAFLFDADPTGPGFGDLLATFHNPTAAHLDRFGHAVAAVGNDVLIGSFGDDTGAPNAGSAHLFDTAAILLQTFRKSTPVDDDWFGWAVASAGGSVLIGVQFEDPHNVVDAGAAYLYGNTTTGSNVQAPATSSDGTPVDVTFEQVTVPGVTTAERVDCPAEPIDSLFELCDPPACHDVSTTATFVPNAGGGVQVCFFYAASGCPVSGAEESNIRLRHDEDLDGVLENITDSGYPDTVNDVVCGTTTHLSLFEIALAALPAYACEGFEPPMNLGAVTVRGNRALPFKARLIDESGMELTGYDLLSPPVIQVLFQAGDDDPVDVSGDALPAGQGTDGNQFEYTSDGKWQFNLKTKNYSAAGSYIVYLASGDNAEYVVESTCQAVFVIE